MVNQLDAGQTIDQITSSLLPCNYVRIEIALRALQVSPPDGDLADEASKFLAAILKKWRAELESAEVP